MASVWRGWASEAAWVQTSRTRLCSAQRLTTELHTHALGYIRLQSHEPHIQERLFSCSHETGCWTQNWTVYTNIRNSQRAAPPGKTRMLKVTTACAQGQMVVDQTTRPGCHSLLLLSPNINTLQKKKLRQDLYVAWEGLCIEILLGHEIVDMYHYTWPQT